MDLDGFKVVNDSLGHETGDRLLVAVSERLKGCLRPEDTLARFGGDEFVVLLEDVEGPQEAVRVAERIIDELKNRFVLDGRELYARASIGIALGEDRTKDPDDLLRDADTAMYRAKDGGLDYSMFDTSDVREGDQQAGGGERPREGRGARGVRPPLPANREPPDRRGLAPWKRW